MGAAACFSCRFSVRVSGVSSQPPGELVGPAFRSVRYIPRNILPADGAVGVVEFFDVLVRYEVALWSAVDQELGRLDQISLGEVHALRVVDRYDGRARVQDLSDDIGITVGAASKLVDRLERDWLVARSPNPASNCCSSLIALTAGGQQALASGMDVCRRAVARAVGEEDVEFLTAALQRLGFPPDRGGFLLGRDRLVGGQVLVGDRAHHMGAAVPPSRL